MKSNCVGEIDYVQRESGEKDNLEFASSGKVVDYVDRRKE